MDFFSFFNFCSGLYLADVCSVYGCYNAKQLSQGRGCPTRTFHFMEARVCENRGVMLERHTCHRMCFGEICMQMCAAVLRLMRLFRQWTGGRQAAHLFGSSSDTAFLFYLVRLLQMNSK